MSANANGRKSIFITGAASGIGLASAKKFAADGWFVGLSDIDVVGLKAALEAIGPANGATFRLDVRDREAWDNALGEFGRLTDGKGCAAVYDSVGADTWRGSLKCLKKRGMFVSFGQSSGMIEGFHLSDLARHGSGQERQLDPAERASARCRPEAGPRPHRHPLFQRRQLLRAV